MQRISRGLVGSIDREGLFALDTCLISDLRGFDSNKFEIEYIMALINSKLLNYWYMKKFVLPTVSGYELHQVPIKVIPKSEQVKIASLVLSLEKSRDPRAIDELDQLIFDLYGIGDEEVKIICGS